MSNTQPTLRECWTIAELSCGQRKCRKILIGATRNSWCRMVENHYPPLPAAVTLADVIDIQMDAVEWENDDSRVCHIRIIPGHGESVRVVAVE
jgi:hypothetical protein